MKVIESLKKNEATDLREEETDHTDYNGRIRNQINGKLLTPTSVKLLNENIAILVWPLNIIFLEKFFNKRYK